MFTQPKNDTPILVDPNFAHILRLQKWFFSYNSDGSVEKVNVVGYDQKIRSLHSIVMNTKKGTFIEHVDGNPLNNQKENLRKTTSHLLKGKVKPWSKSGFKGVWQQGTRWRASITMQTEGTKKNYKLGYFGSPEAAARAYDKAAVAHFGKKYAVTNKTLGLYVNNS